MRLTVTDGPEAGQAFTASQREVSLGRRRNCTVCLHGDSHVSRLHALLRETDSGWTIEDAGSHNGTLLNGRPVTSAVALPEGAEIALGSSTVRVELNPADESLMEAHHDLREVEATGRPQTVVERAFGAEDASNLGAETTGPADTWTPERLAALFALAAPVTSANPLEAILERVMDQLFANVKAERGYLLLENEATGKLAPRAVRRRGSLPEGSGPVEISRTLVHRAVKQRRAILTSDAADDASLRDGTASLAEFGIRSALCVPLIADEAVLGLILLDTQSVADAFTEGDLEFVSVLAGVAALRVNCIRLTARLAHETQLREQLQSFVPDVPLQHLLGGRLDLELGGEIREATILQADIREFTALTERLGPRQLTALLNEYFTA
ncbi:MAG: GAF domain-containing protein, partial [Armatimonadetes bacterium]|nr:GAF domain-containing protein [Armatimonadota bacterium]